MHCLAVLGVAVQRRSRVAKVEVSAELAPGSSGAAPASPPSRPVFPAHDPPPPCLAPPFLHLPTSHRHSEPLLPFITSLQSPDNPGSSPRLQTLNRVASAKPLLPSHVPQSWGERGGRRVSGGPVFSPALRCSRCHFIDEETEAWRSCVSRPR